MEEAAIRRVEHAETILARFHSQIRVEFAVHQDGIAEDFRNPRRIRIARDGIVELRLQIENAIVENERDFILSFRQIQRIFKFIPYEKCSNESGKNVEPVNS